MTELAYLLGGIAVILLVAALATWSNLFGGPILRPIDGRARLSGAQTERGSQLLVVATGVSAVAAVLAVGSWIAG
jgi:hypothetical protein